MLRIVHVVDDDEAVRWSTATQLMTSGFAVQAHQSGQAFLDALRTLDWRGIGCVLAELRAPAEKQMELFDSLKVAGFSLPVVLMAAQGDVALAVSAMRAGAFDLIERPFTADRLVASVSAALDAAAAGAIARMDGEGGPGAIGATARGTGTSLEHPPGIRPGFAEAAARVANLSPRERAVLELAVQGKPGKIIAYELGISPRTVEVHRLRMIARLGVRSIAEAVRLSVWAELAGTEKGPPASRA